MPIIWNINPVIIKIGFFELRYYSLFFVAGILSAYFMFKKINSSDSAERMYPQQQIDNLAFFMIAGTLIGARLGHCLFYDFAYYSKHIFEIFLPFSFDKNAGFVFTGYQGLASHGGALGIVLAIALFCKRYKKNILSVLDKISVVVPVTAGFIRLGNLMNSEIIGKASDSNFAFIFKRIDNIPRHPAQLYESVCYFIIFFIMLYVYKKTDFINVKGKIFGLFLTLTFIFRFFIEFIKENQSAFENAMFLNMGQVLSLPFIFIGVCLFFLKYKKK
ncbi:MAG: prolipoprotein diacylglyceryl transferase [Endomicrobiaceae bacterium]